MLEKSEEKRRYYADRMNYRELYRSSLHAAEALQAENLALKSQLRAVTQERDSFSAGYEAIQNAFWWKLTAPFRHLVDLFSKKPEDIPFKALTIWESPADTPEETDRRKAEDAKCSAVFGIMAQTRSETLETSLAAQTYLHWQWGSEGSDYTLLLRDDCELHPYALSLLAEALSQHDLVYADELSPDENTIAGLKILARGAFSPDVLRSTCDLGTLLGMRTALYQSVQAENACDQLLLLCENAQSIEHLPNLLCRRLTPYVPRATKEGCRALEAHLQRQGLSATVAPTAEGGCYHISYAIEGSPLISIVIPNRDHSGDLSICLESLFARTTYRNFEVLIVRNGEEGEEAEACYAAAQQSWPQLRVVTYTGDFNYSAICNFGVKASRGDYVLLLNNDTEIVSPGWLEELLMLAQRCDVGIVGAKLLYPNETVQHCGMAFTSPTTIEHIYRYAPASNPGMLGCLSSVWEYTAVTGACVLLRRSLYDELGGLDERLAMSFNDVDLCLKAREKGLRVLCTPFALLYHFEGSSRGRNETAEMQELFKKESSLFFERWGKWSEKGDLFVRGYTDILILRSEESVLTR